MHFTICPVNIIVFVFFITQIRMPKKVIVPLPSGYVAPGFEEVLNIFRWVGYHLSLKHQHIKIIQTKVLFLITDFNFHVCCATALRGWLMMFVLWEVKKNVIPLSNLINLMKMMMDEYEGLIWRILVLNNLEQYWHDKRELKDEYERGMEDWLIEANTHTHTHTHTHKQK